MLRETTSTIFEYLEKSFGEAHVVGLVLMAEGDPFLPQAVREGIRDALDTFKLEVEEDRQGKLFLPQDVRTLLLEQYPKHVSA